MAEVTPLSEEEFVKIRRAWCHAATLYEYAKAVDAPTEVVAALEADKERKCEAWSSTRGRRPENFNLKRDAWLDDVAGVLAYAIPYLHGEQVRVRIEADWFVSLRQSSPEATEVVAHTKSLVTGQAHPKFQTRRGDKDVPLTVSFVEYVPEPKE